MGRGPEGEGRRVAGGRAGGREGQRGRKEILPGGPGGGIDQMC